jgi:hypothetical protein
VIGPDGNVVFEAGPEPDSGNLQANWDISKQSESDGQTIDPLVDQSGNGNDATASGAPTMDIDGYNGNPAALLDGSNDRWELSISLTQPYTVYAVFNLLATDGGTVYRDSNTDLVIDYFAADNAWRAFAGSQINGSSDRSISIIGTVIDGSNSVLEEDNVETGTGNVGGDEPVDLGIGGRPAEAEGTGNPFDGYFTQGVIYNTAHNATTRNEVATYLADKWGITL